LLLTTWTYSTVTASKRFARGGLIATHYLDIQYCGPSKRLAGWMSDDIKHCDGFGEVLFQITLAILRKTTSLGSMHGKHQTTVGVTSAD
jgi:hypothetical protein